MSQEQKNGIINKRREFIKSDKQSKKIHVQLQNTHIQGTNEYNRRQEYLRQHNQYGPSYLTISIKEAQELVNKLAGTGKIKVDKNGLPRSSEIIVNDFILGIVTNNITGKSLETNVFKIHYGKNGVHIVPDYPKKEE